MSPFPKTVLGVVMVLGAVGLAWTLAIVLAPWDKSRLTPEGFVANWLLLAPIPLEPHERGARRLDLEVIKDEAQLKPREGDAVVIRGRKLVWRTYPVKDFSFDFNDFLGQRTEYSVGYAVCDIRAPAEMKDVRLLTGSDDEAKIYLNGKEVFKKIQGGALIKDRDIAHITLAKGVNVLVFKVVNEGDAWLGCARFFNTDGEVMRNITATTAPEAPAPD
jgi:hypothetical protein